ncbi:MAG: hypothetical protein C0490_06015 [Marivirga sp.]|nr:hypothetical protein [Marivirga sp.]
MPVFPFILVGPILRRVTPRHVSVWIALSKEATVKLSIWEQEVNTGVGFDVFDEGSIPTLREAAKKTIRITEHLHIVVVTINLEPAAGSPPTLPALIPGKLYSYNLSFTVIGQPPADLKSNKLLIDSENIDDYYGIETDGDGKFFLENGIRFNLKTEDGKLCFTEKVRNEFDEEVENKVFFKPRINLALGYKPGFLPTFVVPPIGLDNLNIVHGSCRNPAGYGKDCLAALDFRIKDGLDEIAKRPHQLYMTGDQIYADIIPVRLMGNLTMLGNELLGYNEKLIVKAGTTPTNSEIFEVTEKVFPVLRRKKLIHKTAMFTAKADAEGFAINHVLSFGEYASAYILYWSNAAWHIQLFMEDKQLEKRTDYLSAWDIVSPADAIIDTVAATELEAKKKKGKEQFDDEVPHFIEFRNKLPYVMRTLANVPVYMLFDDHDVTDDWNINKAWRNAVFTSPMGSSVIRNALMAYTLFQDWGNDPLQYEVAGSSKEKLLADIQKIFPNRANMNADEIALSELESGAFASEISTLFGLDLVDETPPPVKFHYSVPCGEIRIVALDTRTRRTFETLNSPPGLLSDSALVDQIPLEPLADKVVIFISPAPVFGPAIIEELLQPAMLMTDGFSEDPEPWAFSPPALEKFLAKLEQFKKVVFFSGDIHQGMTLTMDYWKKGEPEPARMVQLISSPLKQKKFSQVQFLSSGFVQEVFGSFLYPPERLGFHSNALLGVTNAAGKVNRPKLRMRLRKEPVLLPTKGWPTNSEIKRDGAPVDGPDWAWRMEFIKDERPDDDSPEARPKKIRLGPIEPDVDLEDPGDEGYHKILLRHQQDFRHSVARRVVFNSNIGLVNFKTDELGKLSVVHSLLFWLEDDKDTDEPDIYVLHKASLEPSTAAPPALPIVNS